MRYYDFTEADIAALEAARAPEAAQAFNYELEQDMDDKIKRLIAACAAIRDYLEASTDERDRRIAYKEKVDRMSNKELRADDTPWYMELPADRLRQQIVEMEAKDAKIREFREALEAILAREA